MINFISIGDAKTGTWKCFHGCVFDEWSQDDGEHPVNEPDRGYTRGTSSSPTVCPTVVSDDQMVIAAQHVVSVQRATNKGRSCSIL